jgi:hypothetical protein
MFSKGNRRRGQKEALPPPPSCRNIADVTPHVKLTLLAPGGDYIHPSSWT